MSGSDADRETSSRALRLERDAENRPCLDTAAQQRLGRILARYADAILCEPTPDVFLTLLAKLEAKESEG